MENTFHFPSSSDIVVPDVQWKALLISLALHCLLLCSGHFHMIPRDEHPVEIDITDLGPADTVAAHPNLNRVVLPSPPPPKRVPNPSKTVDTLSPTPTKSVDASDPSPAPQAPAPAPAARSDVQATGSEDKTMVTQLPHLRNLSDLDAILRRFYPAAARDAGREATVVLDLHIDEDGNVSSADIVTSGGADFDAAAERVAPLLRFTPAFIGTKRVAVKMRQAIQFKLTDES